jgi:AraC-like DNA-binding protein
MTSLPLVRVSQFVHVAEAAELLGVSASAVCRRNGLPAWHDCDPDGHAPVSHICRFLNEAARAAGSPAFGMAIMEELPIDHLGKLGRGIAGAGNVYQAIKTAIRLMPGHSNFSKYWLVEKASNIWVCRRGRHRVGFGEDQASLYALFGMIQTVQRGVNAEWWPKLVVLQGSTPDALPPIEGLCGARVLLHSDLTAICVPRAVLPLPTLRQNAEPAASIGSLLDEQGFIKTAPAEVLAQALKQLVATILPHHFPSIETMADIVGVHPRTLQRSRRAQSISYRQLVDEVRAEQATALLRDSNASVTDIAFDLGYADVAHFTRAFRRWNGVSPRQFRGQGIAA